MNSHRIARPVWYTTRHRSTSETSLARSPRAARPWLTLCAAAALCAGGRTALAQDAPPDPGDRLGQAIAFGDFNGDGRMDVAVAAPEARVTGLIMIRVPPSPVALSQAGKVLVLLGTASGGFGPARQLDEAGLALSQDGDEFGRALAVGDFDGDGKADLAIGAPGESVDGQAGAGVVFLFQGTAGGLVPLRAIAAKTDALGQSAAGDGFGSALAVGDFNGDGKADLAVGAPGKAARDGDANGAGAGAVFVFAGGASGGNLVSGMQRVDQELGSLETSEAGDRFGTTLLALDFDGDKRMDLAVGTPGEGLGREPRGSGAVFFYRGGSGGLSGAMTLDQESQTLRGTTLTNQAGDGFGTGMASGDFNGDGRADLAVGAPGKGNDVGQVLVYLGSASGLKIDRSVNGMGMTGARYGLTLSAGDYNGDKRDDLTVGAPGRAGGAGAVGAVYVLVSGNSILEARAFVSDSRDTTRGELGSAIASADVDGDGRVDLAIGVPGAARGGNNAGRLLLLPGNAQPGLGDARDLISLSPSSSSGS